MKIKVCQILGTKSENSGKHFSAERINVIPSLKFKPTSTKKVHFLRKTR